MLKLLLVRHGNTFDKGDIVRRVGLRTNLPLSNSGQHQANALGQYLQQYYPKISQVYCSELLRTHQTASLIMKHVNPAIEPSTLPLLNEIDYGIDDGKIENEVIQRLGPQALAEWDENAVAPQGWNFSAEVCKEEIRKFTAQLIYENKANLDKTILLVTSNGIARFFTSLLDNNEMIEFKKKFQLKMPTASISLLIYHEQQWHCQFWGVRPS